ncbi:MAG: hypothetical protein HY548_10310 [Elusimicrobia bacterium]|nr:hypothetical protein [Elusimicrobiota bacterium]
MRNLLAAVIETRGDVERLKAQLEEAEQRKDQAEQTLIEAMESQGLKTVDYEDLGRATLGKPRVYASCKKENQERLFIYLEDECGRPDLIKRTVFPASLSSFASERMEAGEPLPEFIHMFLKPSLIIKK